MSTAFDFRIEWLEAPGVTTPELAATWARYELWLGDRCVTQVEAADGTFRRGVYGSLYPLAHWIAANWWLLTSHVRPSASDTRYWTWQNLPTYPWLRQHNLRGAGDGMAWPNLTIVPEGAVTRLVWSQDESRRLVPIRFASDGSRILRADEVQVELAAIVDHVLERLVEAGIPKTALAEEWTEVARTDPEEKAFCQTAARMGLDPYSIDDSMADEIVNAADKLPSEIVDDFFDNADTLALSAAADWARRAIPVAERAAIKATQTLRTLQKAISTEANYTDAVDTERPWTFGYAMARQLRHALSVNNVDQFDVSPWVGVGDVSAASHGIYGFAAVNDNRCGVVIGDQGLGVAARRFGQARALGRILARPERQQFILSAARSQDERVARAFAAELLAPAEGIRRTLEAIGKDDDAALEAVAHRFRVSPLLIRHQYDNQIAVTSLRSYW